MGRHYLGFESVARRLYLYVHVENLGIISTEKEFVEVMLYDLVHHFESIGLPMHETAVKTANAELLGVRLDLPASRSQITDMRYHELT